MNATAIAIADLTYDPGHFGPLSLLLTVKSFDLQAIRKRYLASKKNTSGRTGSVARRQPGEGGIVAVALEGGTMTHHDTLLRTKEPRGIDWTPHTLTFAAENTVHIITADGEKQSIHHPWMSYIHTVHWAGHRTGHLLVSSSGLDLLQMYQQDKVVWEWLAWEHGFDEGYDTATKQPVRLTRSEAQARQWQMKGIHHLLIKDPQNTHLPTAMRAAFINSAVFDTMDEQYVLATFFHEGKVYRIDTDTGAAEAVIHGLKNPHGGRRFGKNLLATSTGTGEVIVQSKDLQERYTVKHLPGKPEALAEAEWVQNTITTEREWIIIDSNRTAFIRVDPVANTYCIIPYPDHWAVQDGVPGTITKEQAATLAKC